MLLRYCLFVGTLGLSISAEPVSIHIELTDKYIQKLETFWTPEMRQAAHNNSFQNHGGKDSKVDQPSGHLHRRNPPTYGRDRSPPTLKAGEEQINGRPWVGWLYFIGDVAGRGQPRACIASIVASPSGSVIATAAECVYDKATGKAHHDYVFFPGGTENLWTVQKPCFDGAYTRNPGAYAARWNVAFAKVDKRLGRTLGDTYHDIPQPSFEDLPLADGSPPWLRIWKPSGPAVVPPNIWKSGPSALLRCTYDKWSREAGAFASIFWVPGCTVHHNAVGSPFTHCTTNSPDALVQVGSLMTGPGGENFFVRWDGNTRLLYNLAD